MLQVNLPHGATLVGGGKHFDIKIWLSHDNLLSKGDDFDLSYDTTAHAELSADYFDAVAVPINVNSFVSTQVSLN